MGYLIDAAILIVLVLLAATLVTRFMARRQALPRDRFTQIGETSGKTMEEITRQLGPPTRVTSLDANTVLLTWSDSSERGGYHYEMQFRDGRSLGYTYVDGS